MKIQEVVLKIEYDLDNDTALYLQSIQGSILPEQNGISLTIYDMDNEDKKEVSVSFEKIEELEEIINDFKTKLKLIQKQ